MRRFGRRKKISMRRPVDLPLINSHFTSALIHFSFLLAMLFMWTVDDSELERRPHLFHQFAVVLNTELIEEEIVEMDPELEEDDAIGDLEKKDLSSEAFENDEGKFGDPEQFFVETQVPTTNSRMVRNIDPKKAGLLDLLKSQRANKLGAIASIMANNSTDLSNKLAVAMSGADEAFVMGHGNGGLGFKGTGSGGGGLGGYGSIHGLGKIGLGGAGRIGRFGRLGKKRVRKVSKVRIGRGRSTGFCKKSDISKNVRRRAQSIKACYEQRLQINSKLRGKLTIRWTIGLNGKVRTANVVSASLRDGAVKGCVLRVIRRIRFAKPEGGVCVVQWPFVFASN